MIDYSHLDAIAARLSREKELAAEYKFIGIVPVTIDDLMNDDDLLAELTA